MLPDPQHAPSGLVQLKFHFTVAVLVSLELCVPKLPVLPWPCAVLWTSMPETPVHKYADPLDAKNEVRFANQILLSSPAGQSVCSEDLDQPQFRRLVAPGADTRHHLGSLCFGEDVRHGQAYRGRRRSGTGVRFRPLPAQAAGRRARPTVRRTGKALRRITPPPGPAATLPPQTVSTRAAIRSPRLRIRRDEGREKRRPRRSMRGGRGA